MNQPLLEVDGVTLRSKTPNRLVTATYRVDFKVWPGDRFILLGPSGCGKSTLLKAVGGYMAPAEGEIRLKGRVVTEPGPDRMMVFQEFDQLLPWKTVKQNVVFALEASRRLSGRAAEERAVADALRSGHLGGAALDVFGQEPLDAAGGAMFTDAPNLILTPHIAGVTQESNVRVSTVTARAVRRSLEG